MSGFEVALSKLDTVDSWMAKNGLYSSFYGGLLISPSSRQFDKKSNIGNETSF